MVAIVGLECLETEWNLMVLEARNVRLLEVVKLLMKPAFCTFGYCSQYSKVSAPNSGHFVLLALYLHHASEFVQP